VYTADVAVLWLRLLWCIHACMAWEMVLAGSVRPPKKVLDAEERH
jgi:hypothetical protein